MSEQVVKATPLMWGLVGMSLLVFATGFAVLFSERKRTGRFSWSGFVLTMFLAVLLYNYGIEASSEGGAASFLLSIFRSLQTMMANRDFELPYIVGLSAAQTSILVVYGILLFIFAPVSIVTAALEYFSGMVSRLVLHVRSLFVDCYFFSQLDERTLALAKDICATYRARGRSGLSRPCIVFANCGDADDALTASAHTLGAYCQDESVSDVSRGCSSRRDCSIVLMEDDESTAISTARELKERARRRPAHFGGSTKVFVLTDFRDTEPLLFPEALQEEDHERKDEGAGGKVLVRGMDLTRALIEQVIIKYPLFLLSKPLPGVGVPTTRERIDGAKAIPSSCWYQVDERAVTRNRQREFYERSDRHILVIGAGSTGTEFLSYALWASRIDGLHTRIDIIDNVENPKQPGRPLAEARFAAVAPEIMSLRSEVMASDLDGRDGDEPYDLAFSLIDAETDEYEDFIRERARTISYVFVALGDDLRDARVAMRTRQILERELASNASSRDEYIGANRPLIISVIRDDAFATTVERATNEGQPYDIVCVGSNSDVLTYKMLDTLVGNRKTEYKRQSSRAGNTHVKYRLFAFARNLLLNRYGLREVFDSKPDGEAFDNLQRTLDLSSSDRAFNELRRVLDKPLDDEVVLNILNQVDWTIDVKGNAEETNQVKNWVLALMYQLYCTNGVTYALQSPEGSQEHSREWLLRMEHDRWNAYMRTQGAKVADIGTVEHLFATGQKDTEKHRSNIAGLHPCLLPFDDLALLEPCVYELYQAYNEALDRLNVAEDRNTKVFDGSWARLLDDDYIGIMRPKYKKEE